MEYLWSSDVHALLYTFLLKPAIGSGKHLKARSSGILSDQKDKGIAYPYLDKATSRESGVTLGEHSK
uniref:Uncharacterized protein n=1 Tax=Hyaloperonospora arabidopsidis (strain Emoy2) TaxID=559515 RepID=M4BK24_HYAAE